MLAVPKISDADVVFPANPPIPKEEDIPKQFWDYENIFNQTASDLFNSGKTTTSMTLKSELGEDFEDIRRALRACLGSFGPSHEHKLAGVAYMLSEWFTLDEC